MKRIKDVFLKNKNFKCVIITHNQEEFEILRNILIELHYEHAVPLDTLTNMMNSRVEKDGYVCCWRVSDYMGVCWDEQTNLNKSIQYWKEFCADILEINQAGKLVFVE